MKKTAQQILIMIIFTTILTTCNLPTRPTSTPGINLALAGTIVAMTLESLHTQTPTNTPPVFNSPVPTAAPTQAVTSTQTATITPTYSVPMLRFNGNTNCREGPGTDYKVVTVIINGQQIEAIGVKENYWIIKNPNGAGTCWAINDLVIPSGSTWMLPTVTSPPLPSRLPPTAPVWSNWTYNCDYAPGGSTLTMNLKWTDHANDETGYTIYRSGQAVANLGPDSTTYTDIAFVESGKALSYYVEVYNNAGHSSSSTINTSCQ